MSKATASQKSAGAAKKGQEQDKQAAVKAAAARATKVLAGAKEVAGFKQALSDLGIKPSDVFGHREYEDRIVIVTRAGQKSTWMRK